MSLAVAVALISLAGMACAPTVQATTQAQAPTRATATATAKPTPTAKATAKAKLPVVYNITSTAAGGANPKRSPAGANDWTCKPSAAHPNPVVLVHGTFSNMNVNWGTLSPLLKNEGYCVFALNHGMLPGLFGIGGLAGEARSGREIATFANRVLQATGAAKIDIIGHSQGGGVARYYVNFLGGDQVVEHYVGLAPVSHGTLLSDEGPNLNELINASVPAILRPFTKNLGRTPQALIDMGTKSPFTQLMATRPDTVPGVDYTVISTNQDHIVTPWQAQQLVGPGVHNIVLQDRCASTKADHASVGWERQPLTEVLNALDPAHPRPVACSRDIGGWGNVS